MSKAIFFSTAAVNGVTSATAGNGAHWAGVVAGKRAGEERFAACAVRATTRADVNRTVRSALDVRKASFLPTDRAVELTAMEYGGITPVGLPLSSPTCLVTPDGAEDRLRVGGNLGLEGELLAVDLDRR